MDLKLYKQKRDFSKSPEPAGEVEDEHRQASPQLRFVIQKHKASHLHFDLRLEIDGVYKSWAVPKGPSLDPGARRLAVAVEEHPLAYGEFEGIIPPGNYGAGVVMIWDRGYYWAQGANGKEESLAALHKGLKKGHLTFVLAGQRVRGAFDLVYLKDKKNWLLIKKRDEYSHYRDDPLLGVESSVVTGRSFDEIMSDAPAKNEVWVSNPPVADPLVAAAERRDAGSFGKKKTPSKKPQPLAQPLKVSAMRAVHLRKPLQGDGWVYEPELAGVRALLWKHERAAHLFSVRHLKLDSSHAPLLATLRKIPGSFIVDGEIVAGQYWASDLLYADACDFRGVSYGERRKKLAALVTALSVPEIQLVPSYPQLTELLAAHPSCGEVTAKDPGSTYEGKISPNWLRFKVGATSENVVVRVTHPSKLYWVDEKISKGELVAYYEAIAPWILPHLKDRPLSLNRHPNGAASEGFYHKDFTDYHPDWLATFPIYSKSSQKTINYALCQNMESLLYLANLGCIEFNPWFSTIHALDKPNFLAIDLDPEDHAFADVVHVALAVKALLDEVSLPARVKTSGASGIHIAIPLQPVHGFDEVAQFAEELCKEIERRLPQLTTTERTPARRKKKIYLDYLQNHRGQTLAAPYCVRPRPGAPVSTPLGWEELLADLHPSQFTLRNMLARLAEQPVTLWDLSAGVTLEQYWPKLQDIIKP